MHPCSCCGFLTLREPQGSYEICAVCSWEDDEVQQRWPGYRGGANQESLCEAQASLLKRIASDVQVAQGVRRASGWRPLRSSECVGDDSDPERKAHIYYWHRDVAI